jgi:hypothetical protein
MLVSSARVATEHPRIRLKQFCEHVADERRRHAAPEVEVIFNENEGFVNFAPLIDATCRLDARQERLLVLEARAADRAALERVQRLLTEHLERFGQRGASTVEWGSASQHLSTG